MRMTKQEVKDEFKDVEGRPEVKAQIRRKQREMAELRMMDAVKEADVVITNPEHFASLWFMIQNQMGAYCGCKRA